MPIPSDDIQLCSASGARSGIARKVCRAFPAACRQPRRRASALRRQRNIDILTEKSFWHAVFKWAQTSVMAVPISRSGRATMDGARYLCSFSRVGARRLLRSDPVKLYIQSYTVVRPWKGRTLGPSRGIAFYTVRSKVSKPRAQCSENLI